MLISIIVPVYNTEKYLSECIESILLQSFSDFELLLIDDGSTDNSGEICDEYAEKDKRVRVFHKENGGVSSARNLGLDNALGDYIHFVDSDDIILKGAYQYIAEVISSYCPDVICFDFVRDANENQASIVADGKFYDTIHGFIKQHYLKVSMCFKIIKRQLIEIQKIRFEPIMYSEDTVFCWNLLRGNGNLYYTSSKLYSYTTNPLSAERTRTSQHVQKTVDSLIYSNLRLKEFSPDYLDCPPVISNFSFKYMVLFNRIICIPYSYKKIKPLFAQCAEIGVSHLTTHKIVKLYNILYHHPFCYYLFRDLIRFVYFRRHKISPNGGDFIDRVI